VDADEQEVVFGIREYMRSQMDFLAAGTLCDNHSLMQVADPEQRHEVGSVEAGGICQGLV
jgi:hypothetical protein